MFVLSFKMTKKKIAIAAAAVLLLVVIVIALVMSGGEAEASAMSSGQGVKTNDDRVGFLEAFGWEVEAEPVETREVQIPDALDDVLTEYNAIQTAQGMDLSRYTGKRVKCYTYLVLNYAGAADGEVHANIVVYRDKVIAGDICSTSANGFMHGFEKP